MGHLYSIDLSIDVHRFRMISSKGRSEENKEKSPVVNFSSMISISLGFRTEVRLKPFRALASGIDPGMQWSSLEIFRFSTKFGENMGEHVRNRVKGLILVRFCWWFFWEEIWGNDGEELGEHLMTNGNFHVGIGIGFLQPSHWRCLDPSLLGRGSSIPSIGDVQSHRVREDGVGWDEVGWDDNVLSQLLCNNSYKATPVEQVLCHNSCITTPELA